jgi:hypothetical protein
MTTRKRQIHEIDASSTSSSAMFASVKDHELFMIERDVLARIVLKQHCAYRRIDILDRIKTVVKALDQFLREARHKSWNSEHLRRLIRQASERFFQQLSMGLMIPMSATCLGSLGRLMAILDRGTACNTDKKVISSVCRGMLDDDDDEGVKIER